MSRRALEAVWLGLLVVGLVLMVPFEETITLALGIACLLSFVGLGVYLIAHPSALLAPDDGGGGQPARTTSDPQP